MVKILYRIGEIGTPLAQLAGGSPRIYAGELGFEAERLA
jgi:hypothetical protein